MTVPGLSNVWKRALRAAKSCARTAGIVEKVIVSAMCKFGNIDDVRLGGLRNFVFVTFTDESALREQLKFVRVPLLKFVAKLSRKFELSTVDFINEFF
jgi:hypothetical protein